MLEGNNQPIKSLRELGAAFKDKKQQEFSEMFDQVLKGKLDRVVRAKVEVPETLKNKGINYLIIAPFQHRQGDQDVSFVTVVAALDEGTVNFQINEQGQMTGDRWPKNLDLPREEVACEAMQMIEQMGTDFWTKTDHQILPEADQLEKILTPQMQEFNQRVEKRGTVDPKRIEFFKQHPKVLFGVTNYLTGMDDYRVFVFQDFLVFENPKIGNAAFFLPLTQAIDLDKRVFNVPSSKRLNDETRQEIIDEMIAPVVSNVKTKGQLLDLNAIRVIHVPEEKNWVERMEKEIEQLSASTHQ